MKILYAASEATPFAKSGGLADVAGSLPKALVKDGVDARVIMPLYGDLKFRDKLEYVTNYSVPVGWRSQYCGLFKAEVNGVTYYFLDNEYYFKRRGLYGFYDDGERFAFFSRAVLETLFYIDFTPDIINCNDWQTALVPVYLNLYYRHLDKFNRIKTIFTIHNIAYQGKYGTDILEDTCGIGRRDQHIVEYDGCANFMTVSYTHLDVYKRQVGHDGVRLWPQRGAELPHLQRSLLAGAVPHRRPACGRCGFHALSGLQP